ncbi:unnamed protein product [Cuscuta campestris]|uniref:DUF4283 domain-containing protein n=1 Tax=Cuscuta campestris TaxID=132261 RepID=A0A484N699_9ASTE|nr:unnamed protein product [Cuscuta campestris]
MASHLGEDTKKSFLEDLGSANQPERFPSKQIEKFKGFPAISFTPDEVKSLSAPYEYALVGRFNKSRPPLHIIRSCFERIGFKVNLKIGLLSQSILLLNFKCPLDYQRCFSKRVWKINGSSMIVSKWSSDFHVDIETPIFPIWTSLPHLPVHLQEAKALYSIAKCLGNPLMMDSSTSAKIRPSVARFFVEMDITQELPKKIWIDNGGHGFFQPVSYEDIPKYCRDCQKSGHITGKCNTTDDVFLKKDAATSTKANYKDPKPSRDTGCPNPKETKTTVQNSKANEDVLVTPLEQQEIAKEDMARWGSVAEGTTPTTRGNDTSVQSSKNRSANIEKIPSLEGSSSIQPTAQLEVEEAIVGTQHKADVVEIENAVTMVADAIEIHDGCSTPTLVFQDGMNKPNKTQAAKISPDPQTAIEAKTTTRHTYKETIIEVDGQLFIIEVKEQDDFKTTEKPLEVTKDATSAGSKDEEPQEFAANDTFDASQDNEETRNQTEVEFDCEEYHSHIVIPASYNFTGLSIFCKGLSQLLSTPVDKNSLSNQQPLLNGTTEISGNAIIDSDEGWKCAQSERVCGKEEEKQKESVNRVSTDSALKLELESTPRNYTDAVLDRESIKQFDQVIKDNLSLFRKSMAKIKFLQALNKGQIVNYSGEVLRVTRETTKSFEYIDAALVQEAKYPVYLAYANEDMDAVLNHLCGVQE